MKRKTPVQALAILILVCTTILAGCAAQPSTPAAFLQEETVISDTPAVVTAPPVPTPDPTPTPEPTPTPFQSHLPTADEIYAQMAKVDILAYIPADTYEKAEESRAYEIITADAEKAHALPIQYGEWLKAASNNVISLEIRNVKTAFTIPSWQMLATLAYAYADNPEMMSRALMEACDFDIQVDRVTAGYSVSVTTAPKLPSDLFYSLPETETTTPLGNLFTYAYVATIYDHDMNVRDGIEPRELEPLLFPIAEPQNWYFDDTWYASRDNGARRHTGTDINAAEGTGLLACVDGIIHDAGDGEGTGNYIVVTGADGTQYHYYHMVQPPTLKAGDIVQKGDVVGYVGNTGNSTANHLHFTIITTDGYYLNPYQYLVQSQQETIADNESID